MQKIDRSVWPRAELFRFFSGVSHPFYSVSFRVDVTNLHAYTKAHGISFYYALGCLVTDAINAVENFRYTMRDGEVWLLDERTPSFTDLKPAAVSFTSLPCPRPGRWRNSAGPCRQKVPLSRFSWTPAPSRTPCSTSPARRGST